MGYKATDSCLKKAADDEPIFVLRAKDQFAPILVRMWCLLLQAVCGHNSQKRMEALELAGQMEEWQKKNGCKIPD